MSFGLMGIVGAREFLWSDSGLSVSMVVLESLKNEKGNE